MTWWGVIDQSVGGQIAPPGKHYRDIQTRATMQPANFYKITDASPIGKSIVIRKTTQKSESEKAGRIIHQPDPLDSNRTGVILKIQGMREFQKPDKYAPGK